MISVIMVSNISTRSNLRDGSEVKFIRAVNSFILQGINHTECELIIVSDGCETTNLIYKNYFSEINNIKLIKMPKSNGYPGYYRTIGINYSSFNIITYLDADDFITETRLQKITDYFKLNKVTYVLDQLYCIPKGSDFEKYRKMPKSKILYNRLGHVFECYKTTWEGGTYQISHIKDIGIEWKSMEKRGEDTDFVSRIIKKYGKSNQNTAEIGDYLVCHHPDFGFDI